MDTKILFEAFKPEIERIDAAIGQDIQTAGNEHLKKVLDYALLNGGKRIRPLLTVFTSRLIGTLDAERQRSIYRTAMLFEYLHAASLLHDDVIDRSQTRRGRPTANKVWGVTPVILAGDYLHTRAMLLAGQAGESVLALVCRATSSMIEAEFLQAQVAENGSEKEADYLAVLQGKTGALIAAAAQTGILLAGGTDQHRQAVATFAENLGLAFQIVDDLLDYLGDTVKTGKTVGNDFQEGKMTLPVIHALRQAECADQQRLRELLKLPSEQRFDHFSEAKHILETAQAFQSAREKAESLIAAAIDQLAVFPEGQIRSVLHGLALYVLNRDK